MKLAIVGVGKMGSALLEGILRGGVLAPQDVGILDHDQTKVQTLVERLGVIALKNFEDIGRAERVLLAIQPKQFFALTEPGHKSPLSHADTGYISMMAGISTETLAQRLGTHRVVRVMPNLAVTVGLASTAITAPKEAHQAQDYNFGHALFAAVGDVYDITEPLFNVFTALSGSGPAYVAVFTEALADGAVRMGLPRALALELATKLMIGSGELILKRPHPAILKDEVSSPGGTTIAGVVAMENAGVRAGVIDAIRAATERGNELGKDN